MGQECAKTDTTALRRRASQSECPDLVENRPQSSQGILDQGLKYSHPLMESRSYSSQALFPHKEGKFSQPISFASSQSNPYLIGSRPSSSQSNPYLIDSRPSSSQSNHYFLDKFPSLSHAKLRLVSSQPELHLIGSPARKQRILMLGLDGAGKSTLFQRIRDTKKGTHAEAPLKPSIAYNVTSLDIDGRACTLWDVSGSPLTRDLWKHYFSGTDCLVWVVDSSNLCRLQESRTLLQKIVTHRALRGVPVVVVANKQDLPTARNKFETEELLQLDLVRQEGHFVKVVTTSATTGKDTRKVLKKFKQILKTNINSNASVY